MKRQLTPVQAEYFTLWQKVCIEQGWTVLTTKEREAKRHTVTRRALRYEESSKNFSPAEWDRVLTALRLLADSANLNAQLDMDAYDSLPDWRVLHRARRYSRRDGDPGEVRRLKKSILRNITPAYAASLAHDIFQTTDWEVLCVGSLEMLRDRAAQIGRDGGRKEAQEAQEPSEVPF